MLADPAHAAAQPAAISVCPRCFTTCSGHLWCCAGRPCCTAQYASSWQAWTSQTQSLMRLGSCLPGEASPAGADREQLQPRHRSQTLSQPATQCLEGSGTCPTHCTMSCAAAGRSGHIADSSHAGAMLRTLCCAQKSQTSTYSCIWPSAGALSLVFECSKAWVVKLVTHAGASTGGF